MNAKRIFLIFVLVMPMALTAHAEDGSTSANMHVTLEVLKSCAVSAEDMNFGKHASSETDELTADSTVTVICTSGTEYKLNATSANGGSNAFTLVSGNSSVAYNLYADDAKTQQVTSTTPIENMTGTGNEQEITLYGKIASGALALVPAGTYEDDVTLQVTY